MDKIPQEGSLLETVVMVYWRRNATTEVDGRAYVANIHGAMDCPIPSTTDFTAYPDLTFEQVCSWLDAGLDVPQLNAYLNSQLVNLINPPIINLPWIPTPNPAPSGI